MDISSIVSCPTCGRNMLRDVTSGTYRCRCDPEQEVRTVTASALRCPICYCDNPNFLPILTSDLDLYGVICYSEICKGSTMITFEGGRICDVQSTISQTDQGPPTLAG